MKKADKEKENSILNGHAFIDDWEMSRDKLAKAAFKIFEEWKIKVDWTAQNNTYWFKEKEVCNIDVIAYCQNDTFIAINVYTNLEKDGIKSLLKNIKNIKKYSSTYKDKKFYGGVAFIEDKNDGAVEYAYEKGLFVIKVTPKSARIINDKNFIPKIY